MVVNKAEPYVLRNDGTFRFPVPMCYGTFCWWVLRCCWWVLRCTVWVLVCADRILLAMIASKDLKELQAIWMINAVEDLYTRGNTMGEKDKLQYCFNFAMEDANNFIAKVGPIYSLIPNEIYAANQITLAQLLTTRGSKQFDPTAFHRKACKCKVRLLNIAAAWLEFLNEKHEKPGKYSSGIDVQDRLALFESELHRRCEYDIKISI